jgi:FkbM family methyltransferase
MHKIIKKFKKYLLSKVLKYNFLQGPLFIKLVSFFLKPNFNFHTKELTDRFNNNLFIARYSRLYYYVDGIEFRIKSLLNEYLILTTPLEINEDDILVDVGANIGEFSIGASEIFNFKKVIAIEPDPTEFSVLNKNLTRILNKEIYNVGLTNISKGKIKFFLNNQTGDSSFDNPSSNIIEVETMTLDEILIHTPSIGLLKLEAEGHEPMILQGGENTLKKIKYITVDVGPELNGKSTFDEVNKILITNNFLLLNKGKTRETVLYKNTKLIK